LGLGLIGCRVTTNMPGLESLGWVGLGLTGGDQDTTVVLVLILILVLVLVFVTKVAGLLGVGLGADGSLPPILVEATMAVVGRWVDGVRGKPVSLGVPFASTAGAARMPVARPVRRTRVFMVGQVIDQGKGE
jgi:hypothetical protein